MSQVMVRDVDIKTADGVCDAAFIYPGSGSHPGVILWPDAFGLRPSMRDLGKRVAAEGFTVLVPNPFYRLGKDPFTDASNFDFAKDRGKIMPLMDSIKAAGAAETDAAAFVSFLDSQKEVDTSKKIGAQGYCMGGALVMRTCAAVPSRLGAGATFHAGGMVTGEPSSPHLLVPKMKSRMYIAIAANDDAAQPDAKDKLKEAFASAHVPAEVEVYAGCLHGWCVSDMPKHEGKPIYNPAEADRAFTNLIALYKAALT